MYLQKLVISGFKSFAESTTFTFDAPYVAIVGPNGSGKTNVSDAMRWVMGEQSLKLMRMKTHTDAIFAGSASRTRLGLAQVDLYINNKDHRLPIEYDEVVISRRLARDNETEYLINKQKVRLQDIILLLAQANFGQKSYGVIGQGMITDILNANPQDRKNFFDEATGVKEFQIKRDQAINKLIRTEDNLVRVEDVLREIEPRVQSLSRQVKKLEKRQEVAGKLATVQTTYYGSLLLELTNTLKELATQKQTITGDYDTTHSKLTGVETAIDQIGKEQSRTELYHRLQQEYQRVLAQKNHLLKEQAIIQGRLEVEQERNGEIDLLWLKRRGDDVHNRLTAAEQDRTITTEAATHQSTQLRKLDNALSDVQHELTKLQAELTQANTGLLHISETMTVPEIKQQLTHLFQRQEQFLRELLETNSLERFKTVQQQAQGITEALADLLDKLHEDRAEDIALQKRLVVSVEQRIKTTTALKEKLLNEHTTLRITIEGHKQKTGLLSQTIEALNSEWKQLQKEITAQEQTLVKTGKDSGQLAGYRQKSQQLIASLEQIEEELRTKQISMDEFNQTEEAKKQRLLELQTQARQIQTALNQLSNRLQGVDIEMTKAQTKRETLLAELAREVTAETQAAVLEWKHVQSNHDALLIQIEQLKHQLELIGGIDPEIVKEYQDTKERFDFLSTQSKDLRDTITSLEQIIDELDITIKHQFDKSFKAINKNFGHYFTVLFGGGEAKLEMLITENAEEEQKAQKVGITENSEVKPEGAEENLKPTSLGKQKKKQRIVSGIEIIAHPPGKKLSTIHALSGGEKSLTSIALLCSIIGANTPPFVVMDEVEAALDEANSEKFAAIIKHLADKTQFVVITHNRATMQQAEVLYG
ncbi:MAG: AAA family ATPase, partial [Candidatus Kerfeldbacteria bacterium]|nr:AAA family ATPase [Candidatus Kerfeldbacteria bacterium]